MKSGAAGESRPCAGLLTDAPPWASVRPQKQPRRGKGPAHGAAGLRAGAAAAHRPGLLWGPAAGGLRARRAGPGARRPAARRSPRLCPQEMVDWFNALRAARFHYLQVAFPGASDADVSGCGSP